MNENNVEFQLSQVRSIRLIGSYSSFFLFYINIYAETPEVDLDALLEDLCIMERDIKESSVATLKRKGYNINSDSERTLDSVGSASTMTTTMSDDDRDVHEFRPNSPSYKPSSSVMVSLKFLKKLKGRISFLLIMYNDGIYTRWRPPQ